MEYPVERFVVGQVGPMSLGDVRYIKFAATVMPFVAFIGGIVVGYYLIRPTLQDLQYVVNVAKQILPVFGIKQ